jgi:hypothetical protein
MDRTLKSPLSRKILVRPRTRNIELAKLRSPRSRWIIILSSKRDRIRERPVGDGVFLLVVPHRRALDHGYEQNSITDIPEIEGRVLTPR